MAVVKIDANRRQKSSFLKQVSFCLNRPFRFGDIVVRIGPWFLISPSCSRASADLTQVRHVRAGQCWTLNRCDFYYHHRCYYALRTQIQESKVGHVTFLQFPAGLPFRISVQSYRGSFKRVYILRTNGRIEFERSAFRKGDFSLWFEKFSRQTSISFIDS